MSLILRALAILIALIVSAVTKMHAVIFGQPVTISALWLAGAVIVLILAALVLYLAWLVMRERPKPEYRPVYVITSLA